VLKHSSIKTAAVIPGAVFSMKNQRQTIRKIVSALNDSEQDGGFWLPNIQRPFVWDEDQICKLFDSILRE
jgi:uncharacterized protein with ParB-like and HNH nuclease domain